MPLPQRAALRGRERDEAERAVLGIVADELRERGKLQQITVFQQAPDGALEDVARVGGEAAGAAVVARDALASTKRFARGPRSAGGDAHVATVERRGELVLAVVGSAPNGALRAAEAQAAVAELARTAARVLARAAAQPEPAGEARGAYGARLGDAVQLLERPPILAESRLRLEHALARPQPAVADAIRIVETDAGLATAVVAEANRVARRRTGVLSVPEAFEVLGPRGVQRVAAELPTLRSLAANGLGGALARISAHGVATRAATAMIARAVAAPHRDQLRLAAALHDVGKLALVAGGGDYARLLGDPLQTPETRLAEERRGVTIDHAAIGAVILRRLGLPKQLATTVERHHAADATGDAAIVRLADMVAHHAHGDAITPAALAATARALHVGPEELQRIAYDLPRGREPRETAGDPSPLSSMQEKVLHWLARGKTYRDIAAELGVSESTVRTHLHNLYRKLGVHDRAQAVLMAVERGWI